jgi:hypothetical protein
VERYVISRRRTGWGDCLVSAISAWHYARRTGRTLVIDWRRSLYLDDPGRNAFPAYLEPVDAIGGVPVVSDDSVGQRAWPTPVHESLGHRAEQGLRGWLAARDLPATAALSATAYQRSHAEESALVERGQDLAAPTVVLRCSLSEGLPDRASCQAFLAALTPLPELGAEIERFARARFAGRPTVGVHVRYGSRALLDSHHPFWHDEQRALVVIAAAIERAAALLGSSQIFLCTDHPRVVAALAGRFPRLILREKFLGREGDRELHSWLNPAAIRRAVGRDALIEMLLLARVDALVCYPPHSFFSFYARTCAGGPGLQILEGFEPQSASREAG